MELRDHPAMTYLGRCSWPPEWRGPYGPNDPLPVGEVGILVRAEASNILHKPHCVVVMRWNNGEYFGILYFETEEFSQEIIRILKNCIGRPIAEIGRMHVP